MATSRLAGQKGADTASTSLQSLLHDGTDRPFRELLYALVRLSNLMRANQQHFAEYIGMGLPQFMMMMVVVDAPGCTVGHIASQLEVSSQFVTTEVGKLLRKGVLEKRRNEADARSVLLRLSPYGEKLLRELAPVRRKTNDRMFKSLAPDQIAQLRSIVAALLTDGRAALHDLEAPNRKNLRAPSLEEAKLTKGNRNHSQP